MTFPLTRSTNRARFFGISGPTLALDFVDGGVFDPRITFTRASTATFFNSAGVLTSAAINAPRLDYNPSTLAARGLLIEEARTNLLLQSEDFATSWAKDANSTLTVNVEVAPNGLAVADKLAVGTSTFPQITQSVTSSASNTYTLSCFVKADGLNFIQFRLRTSPTFTNYFRAIFNLSTGAISLPTGSGTGTYLTGSASFVGNGWWRVSITGVPDTGGGATIQAVAILTVDAAGTVATPANSSATDGVLFFGAQLEAGAFPTSYIPTTTTALTRSADVASVNTLSPWYNAAEGTLFTEAQSLRPGTDTTRLVALSDNTANNSIRLNAANITNAVVTLGANEATFALSYVVGGVNKWAIAYASNNTNGAVNGVTGTTDTTVAVPVVDRMEIGRLANGTSGSPLVGHLRRIAYFPRRLPNAELQSLTA